MTSIHVPAKNPTGQHNTARTSRHNSNDDFEDDDFQNGAGLRDDIDIETILSPTISRTQSTFRQSHSQASRALKPNHGGDSARDTKQRPVPDLRNKASGLGLFRPRAFSDDAGRPVADLEKSKFPSFNLPSLHLPQLSPFGSGASNGNGNDVNKEKHALRKRSMGFIKMTNPFSNSHTQTGATEAEKPAPSLPPRPMKDPPSSFKNPTVPVQQIPTIIAPDTAPPNSAYPPRHSRSSSESDSLGLQRTYSGTSSIGSDTRFLDSRPINARYKALKDSILPDVNSFSFSTSNLNIMKIGSNSPAPIEADPIDRLSGDVVLMGGYRGSVLRKVKPSLTHPGEKRLGKTLWIPMKVGLNLQNVELDVPLDPEAELLMEDHICSTDMLRNIAGVDISRRLIKRLEMNKNVRLHVWHYDWRLSPHINSAKLLAFVANLPSNQSVETAQAGGVPIPPNEDRPIIICHSHGGHLTRHAVNQNPSLFGGIIYAGTPQRCINVLGPLRNGDSIALNKTVLSAQANFSFRSTFCFLPTDGRCFVDKTTGEDILIDFYDPLTWQEYNLSPCVSKSQIYVEPPNTLLGSASGALKDVRDKISRWNPLLSPRFRKPGDGDNSADATASAVNLPDTVNDAPQSHLSAAAQEAVATGAGVAGPNMVSSSGNDDPKGVCTLPLSVTMPYLERTLKEAKQFRSELEFRPWLQEYYPPMVVLYSKTTPTVKAAKVDGLEGIKTSTYDDILFGAGDGVVLAREAMLPPGYKQTGRVHTDRGHIGLLGDMDAVKQCVSLLLDERARRKGRNPRAATKRVPSSA